MAKDTYYFSHDYHARSDKKMIRMLAKSGVESIGIYWCLIEMLYEEGGFLPLEECDCIADELRTQCERIENVIKDYKLFDNDGVRFWSKSVLNRIDLRNEKSKKAQQSAKNRWEKHANALQSQSEGNAIKEKKGNKIKGKENIFIPPSLIEVKAYFNEKGYSEKTAITAFNYYDSANWHDSRGKEVKSWKQKMVSVWFKDENKNIDASVHPLKPVIDHRKNAEAWK